MHQAGGSAGRKKDASRCSAVRQRGATILAADINFWVSAKTSHSRAVPSLDAVTTRLSSGLNAALLILDRVVKERGADHILSSPGRRYEFGDRRVAHFSVAGAR